MDIVEETWKYQHKIEDKTRHFGKGKYGRVLKMARKPTNEEFIRTLQLTSIGIVLIGGMGFLIYWCWTYLPGHIERLFG